MAVPKKRTSKAKKNMRKFKWKQKFLNAISKYSGFDEVWLQSQREIGTSRKREVIAYLKAQRKSPSFN